MATIARWRRTLAGILSLVPFGSVPLAATYLDPYVIESPTGTHDTYFGQAVATVGNLIAVGSYVPEPVVYIFDGATGALVRTLPPPASGEAFGASLAAVDGNLIAGSLFHHAYLFDPTSGALLQTFALPGASNLGYSLAALGSDAVVGAPNDDRAYVFDHMSGTILRTFVGPVAGDGFGRTVAASGNTVLVAAPYGAGQTGVAYVFDGATAQLVHTLSNPTPDPGDLFGDGSAVGPGGVLVGAPGDDWSGAEAGVAYLFDAATGQLLRTFTPPAPAPSLNFGSAVAFRGNDVVISARNANGRDGAVYVFDAADGALLATLTPPAGSHGGAGYSLAIAGDDVLAGAVYADDEAGAVFLFPACGNGTTSLGEECDDGSTASDDGCSSTCFLELCGAGPDPTCRTVRTRASSLAMSNPTDPSHAKLKWKWTRGAATAPDDFGDPLVSTPYALCIWDQADTPTPQLLRHFRIPAGGSCAGRPCWSASSSGRIRYADAVHDPSGVRHVQLSPGAADAAKLALDGIGALLDLPAPPLTPPVRVELRRAGASVCWGATYTTPLRNGGGAFKARSD